MSKFSKARDVTYGIRERYLWELIWPRAERSAAMRGCRRSSAPRCTTACWRRSIRSCSPTLTFAFLGMPRTTRQSRNFSMAGAVLAVFAIRLAGFACSIMTNAHPWFAVLQYLLLAAAIATQRLGDRAPHRDRAAGPADGADQRPHRVDRAPPAASDAVMTRGQPMFVNTLGRYFAGRFVTASLGVFFGLFVLLVFVDYIDLLRRAGGLPSRRCVIAQTSMYRVPQLLERLMPFCILIGAMTCYLALSRRLELVVARAAGVSAWQFIAPALWSALLLGVFATVVFNPISAHYAGARQADGSRNVRRVRRRPAGRQRLLDQSGQQRGPGHHQRRAQPAAGRAADRADRVPIRDRFQLQGPDRSPRGDAGTRLLAVQDGTALHARRARRSTRTRCCCRPP